MKKSVSDCPLCSDHNAQEYSRDKSRSYLICPQCQLIFVPRDQMIQPEQEKQRYDSHQNDETDPHYQNYLQQIVNQVLPSLKTGQRGLDFGCGRTDLMAQLFKTHHYSVDSFDLYFLPEEKVWDRKYDFIILSEVIEHLREPMQEMQKLRQLLLPDGAIYIKTKLHPEKKELFDNWFYKRDNTHVQFFDLISLGKLGNKLKMRGPELIGEDLFRFTS